MPVLITSMGRAGSSMITRMLNLCGLYLGDESEMTPPDQANSEGYWEVLKVNKFNEATLWRLGGDWDQAPVYHPAKYADVPELIAPINAMRGLIADFQAAGQPFWGLKDPRFSLLLDLWRELLGADDLKVVVCLRNPVAAVKSLLTLEFPAENGFYNWSTHYRTLFEQMRDTPFIVTHYDAYFFDPAAEIKRVADFIGLPATEEQLKEAASFVNLKLRRHHSDDQELFASDAPLNVVEQYLELERQAGPVYARLKAEQAAQSNQPPFQPHAPLSEADQLKIMALRWHKAQEELKNLRPLKSKNEQQSQQIHHLQDHLAYLESRYQALEQQFGQWQSIAAGELEHQLRSIARLEQELTEARAIRQGRYLERLKGRLSANSNHSKPS